MIKRRIAGILKDAIERCKQGGVFPPDVDVEPVIEVPREEEHGDYSSNVAFLLAKKVRRRPEEIARNLIDNMRADDLCDRVELASKGFINFYVRSRVYGSALKEIFEQGTGVLLPDVGKGERVLIEFVSANPTGPLHIGHGRGAAVGDVLARMLDITGYSVVKEYYVNDAGRQIETLGKSVYLRWKQLRGEEVEYPKDLYQGDYVTEIAQLLLSESTMVIPEDQEQAISFMARFASNLVMDGIRGDLENFGVYFDNYYRESLLFENGLVDRIIGILRERNCLYEEDGALWFRMKDMGDEKDRVIVRSNGEKTYFASDIAYHWEKYDRGFQTLIDIWGSDHHGYIPRMKASLEALGQRGEGLKPILIQFVTLLKDGKPVGMSTRSGEFTTLREVVDEVGRDVARFFFLMRKSDAHLEFDLDLAKKTSNENPVYYVQYAHARIESVFRNAKQDGIDIENLDGADLDLLTSKEEISLMKGILRFRDVLEGGAKSLEPHRVTFYLMDLVGMFHSYYNKTRVLKNELRLTQARLLLLRVLQGVIRKGLDILGISAPEKM
ncbi:MAG TPA: arginine--tRNA ligase [Deltaproteobacteria bacterium]|nr:arginine--tRNA ligase [Deltaproteobacteria bacterium]